MYYYKCARDTIETRTLRWAFQSTNQGNRSWLISAFPLGCERIFAPHSSGGVAQSITELGDDRITIELLTLQSISPPLLKIEPIRYYMYPGKRMALQDCFACCA